MAPGAPPGAILEVSNSENTSSPTRDYLKETLRESFVIWGCCKGENTRENAVALRTTPGADILLPVKLAQEVR